MGDYMDRQNLQDLLQIGKSSNDVHAEIERIINKVKNSCLKMVELTKDNYPELSKLWYAFAINLSKPEQVVSTTYSDMGPLINQYVIKAKEESLCKEELKTISETITNFETITKTLMQEENQDQPLIMPNPGEAQQSKNELIKRIKSNLKKSETNINKNESLIETIKQIKSAKNAT